MAIKPFSTLQTTIKEYEDHIEECGREHPLMWNTPTFGVKPMLDHALGKNCWVKVEMYMTKEELEKIDLNNLLGLYEKPYVVVLRKVARAIYASLITKEGIIIYDAKSFTVFMKEFWQLVRSGMIKTNIPLGD